MFHRRQKTNFRVTEFSLSGGYLHSLLKAKYTYINIGDLFDYVADALWHVVGARRNSVNFTLINVCSPFTNFSHGSSIAPPVIASPKGQALILTFALNYRQGYNAIVGPVTVHHHSNSVTRWGINGKSDDFVSISVNMVLGAELGCAHPRANELEYIYNLIGPMTKSIVRRQNSYLTAERDYQELHEEKNLRDLHKDIYRMPLKQLFMQVPIYLWVFNYHLWEYAPNVIPQRLITPSAALYFFMYLTNSVAIEAKRDGDVTMKRLGLNSDQLENNNSSGIAGVLASSILSFVQMVKTPGDKQLSDIELLAPAVLQKFLQTGDTQIDTSHDYRMQMRISFAQLIADLQVRQNDLGALFLPAKKLAQRILKKDSNLRDTLNRAMQYPQSDVVRSDS